MRHRAGAPRLVGRQPGWCPTCPRRCAPGRKARSTSSSRWPSAVRWIRASCCSPTTAWCGSARGFLLGIAIATPLGFLLGVSPTADPHVRSDHAGAAADLAAGLAAARARSCSRNPSRRRSSPSRSARCGRRSSTRWWACARSRRTTGTSPRCCGCRSSRPSRRSSCRRRCRTCSPAIASASASPGSSSSPARCSPARPGVGGFLWQEYNSLVYAHILLAILTIGVVGFALDRLMGYGGSQSCGPCRLAVHRGQRSLQVASRSPIKAARHVLRDVSLVGRARRVRLHRRRDGQRQVDAAQPAGRADDARRGHDHGSAASRCAGSAATPRSSSRTIRCCPWLTALENVRLAVEAAFPEMTRDEQRAQAHADARAGGTGQRARPSAAAAVGRHAPARGHRPGVRDEIRRSCFSTNRSARSMR